MDNSPEITPLDSHADDRSPSPQIRPPRRIGQFVADRRARLVATAVVCVALFSCLLSQAIPDARHRVSALVFPPAPFPTATVAPTPILVPTPLPVTGLLASPPNNCPSSPPLDSVIAQPGGFTSPVTLYGHSPIWIAADGGFSSQGMIRIQQQPGTPDPYPGVLIVWEVGPTQYPTFTARVSDIATGEPAWWNTAGSIYATLSPVLTLSVRDPSSTAILTGPTFFGWPMSLVFTHAGCYKLDVTWSGGEWYTIFAAGGATS